MLKTKVKISKVNNLTDARYFAAMGADYLGFCCNIGTELYCSPIKLKEITNWVSGPKTVLEFEGWQDASEIQQFLATDQLGDALHFGIVSTYTNAFSVPVFKDFIFDNVEVNDLPFCDFPVIRSEKSFGQLSLVEQEKLKNILEAKPCYIDFNLNLQDLETILDRFPILGIILRGGPEERVGVKSFEQLDEIFEMLEN